MREELSRLIVETATSDPKVIILSGDHGYALFDGIRKKSPHQFVNVGVMEQSMIGIAAGLAKQGRKPIVYGLSAFMPIRVLEQIKLDVCYSNLPVIFLGDGAGLVYSTLGSSHQCAEDIACLQPLPHIQIYSPANARELTLCFQDAHSKHGPSYIRIGKSDRPDIDTITQPNLIPYLTTFPESSADSTSGSRQTLFIATGSMLSIAHEIAKKTRAACLSVPQIKPLSHQILDVIACYQEVYIFEEHSRHGGLSSVILDLLVEKKRRIPQIEIFSLKSKFAERCGSYQYALSEHGISDDQLRKHFKC
jgi:transketolase